MTEPGGQPNKMAEVAGLAASIADRILEQHGAGTSIPPEQFRMLVQAAKMLLDNGVQWPPSVAYLVMEVEKRVQEAEAAASEPSSGRKGDNVVELPAQGLSTKKRV
ncbi:hypothetical protein [Methylobacterium sp. J-070]|uniref:hypothetical protein n=1 Tax=Methylobacterium sp. J-070 TaxID=2836650 RepID=UPI001FB8D7D9|nr:hypothetical protein [Methylobacterium sp. J-070]MCJ2052101.1 hypothetical protein [Methylobacterium sp. J-070]